MYIFMDIIGLVCSKEVWKLNFRQYGQMERAQPGRNSDVEKVRREKIRDGESQKKEDAGARKGREVAKHCVFPVFCGSGGSKSRLAKAAGAETSGQMRNEKLHAVVARSTFGSQKCQSTPFSDHFWKLSCGLWRKAHFGVINKCVKAHHVRTPFGS